MTFIVVGVLGGVAIWRLRLPACSSSDERSAESLEQFPSQGQ